MSRRSVPNIDPNDLRDHASAERIERVWSRVESDLKSQGLMPAPDALTDGLDSNVRGSAGPNGVWGAASRKPLWDRKPLGQGRKPAVWAVLAAAAVFGGGILVGRVALRGPGDKSVPVGSTLDASVDVFAAGSQSRSFRLPNGGAILLEPESTVEVAEVADNGMTLRLLRGSASIDNTRAAGGSVAIVAGEARLTASAGGVMAVRRNERDMDVIVSAGTIDLDAPGVHQRLSNGDRLHAVPISTPTAVLDPASRREVDGPLQPTRGLRVAHEGHAERAPGEVVPEAISQASWYSKYRIGDDETALKLLEQSGDIKSVILNAQSGAELAALSDLNGKRTDLWLLAARRAVDEFPHDPKVVGLPMSLGNYYSQQGCTPAARCAELANKYFALAGSLFADDVECRGLRSADPSSAETAEKARGYLAKYPNGSCRADAELLTGEGEAPKGEPDSDPKPEKKPDAGKSDPKSDSPKGDSSKGDSPKGDSPKSDAPKTDAPKGDGAKPEGSPKGPSAPATSPIDAKQRPIQGEKSPADKPGAKPPSDKRVP